MPAAPRRPCLKPSCGVLTNSGYCEKHTIQKKEEVRIKDRYRGSATSRGYDYRWKKARDVYIKEHPLCVMCEKEGLLKLGNTVDHIIPHRGDQILFWDQSNWQTLCAVHHSVKSASEDGAYGNPIKSNERERFI